MASKSLLFTVLAASLLLGCGSNHPAPRGSYLHFVSPDAGKTLSGTATLRLEMSLPDVIERFEIGVEGDTLSVFQSPLPELEFDTSTISNGSHSFIARATTASGKRYEDTLDVVIENAPHQLEYYRLYRPSYAKGETVSVELKYPEAGLRLSVDFSELDSEFRTRSVTVRDLGAGSYEIQIPLSSRNSAPDGLHDVIVKATNTKGEETSSKLSIRLQSLPTIPVSVTRAVFVDAADPAVALLESAAPKLVQGSGPNHLTSGLNADLTVAWHSDGLPADRLIVSAEGHHGYYVLPVAAGSTQTNLGLLLEAPSASATGDPFTILIGAIDVLGQSLGMWSHQVTPHYIGGTGAKVFLTWDKPMDLDLKVTTPGGTTIGYDLPSGDGGTLEMDSNSLCMIDDKNTEVVAWPAGNEPVGEFTISAEVFNACALDQANYKVVAVACGETREFRGTFLASDVGTPRGHREIGTFKVDCERRVHGTVGYVATDKQVVPTAGMPIRVVTGTADAPTILAQATTGTSGEYAFYLPVTGVSDYHVEVEASWKNPRTGDLMVSVMPKESDDVYFAKSETVSASDLADRTLDLRLDWNHGAGPLQMADTARRGYAWIDGHFSPVWAEMVEPVDIRWTMDAYAGVWNECGSYYDGTIHMGGQESNRDELDSSVVAHEFMHHVAYSMTEWIAQGQHYFSSFSKPGLAYSEGLATALAQQALGNPRYRDTNEGMVYSVDLEDRSNETSDVTRGSGRGTSDRASMSGDVNEFLVAAVLWDLMDPLGDPIREAHDQITNSYNATLGSITRYVPMDDRADRGPEGLDFVDFLDGWRCYSPDVSPAKLQALLDERDFPYDNANGLCRR